MAVIGPRLSFLTAARHIHDLFILLWYDRYVGYGPDHSSRPYSWLDPAIITTEKVETAQQEPNQESAGLPIR